MESHFLWIFGKRCENLRTESIGLHNMPKKAQGAFKYGGYEFFKKFYSDLAGEETAYKYKTSLYLAASASAEFIADIALCPFEAVKVRMQTTIPPFATGTMDGISKITGAEGVAGYVSNLRCIALEGITGGLPLHTDYTKVSIPCGADKSLTR